MKQPNHICRNCGKHYYACKYCDRTVNWRNLAYSYDCYTKYTEKVVSARANNQRVDILPLRTDMTEHEVSALLEKPIDEVKEETKAELSEYADELEILGFSGVANKINEELNSSESKNKRLKNTKEKQ